MSQTAIEPLDVHIVSGTVSISEGGEKRPKETRTSHRTAVLTAANPSYNVAGYDPARTYVYLNVLDNPVVVSDSTSMANDSANLTGTLANPNGRILPVSNGSEYCIPGQDEMWLSTNTYPTRIGITIVREI